MICDQIKQNGGVMAFIINKKVFFVFFSSSLQLCDVLNQNNFFNKEEGDCVLTYLRRRDF